MKQSYLILSIVALLFNCSLFAQNEKEKAIIKKLNRVKLGKFLDSNSAWVISENRDTISYSQFKGKWLLIDFWSTGCGPCIKEFPDLAKFYKSHKTKIEVIAVSVDNDFKKYIRSAKKYNISVPHFYGGFTYNNDIFNLNIKSFKTKEGEYKFNTLTPQYVLVNPEGEIVDKNIPKPSSKEFKSLMDKYLNEK